jgi:heme oxygenase
MAVEGSMPLMDDNLTLDVYVATLRRLRSIVAAWEACLTASPDRPGDALVADRIRLPLLVSDIEALSADHSVAETCELPAFENQGQLIGAMYVMEGSRLGGQLIARHVEKVFDLPERHGTSFFRGFGAQTGPMWSEFVAHLRQEVSESQTNDVIVGAKKMFGAFGVWMRGDSR